MISDKEWSIRVAKAVILGTSYVQVLGPDLQTILRQTYDYLTITPKLRSTYDGRLIYKTSYKERADFLRYDSLAKL